MRSALSKLRATMPPSEVPVSIDLTKFGLGEMLRCSLELRRVARHEYTMEATARRITQFLYDELATREGGRACVLVRCYKTHPFGGLPADLQVFARRSLLSTEPHVEPSNSMRCLTLLATAGDESSWNERQQSMNHQAIALPSAEIIQRAPMIAQLIYGFGLTLTDLLQPSRDVLRKLEGKTYGVFHVEHAAGSPFIPEQANFVERYGIRSVVGFGGSLLSGDLFAVILFTRTRISVDIAERFRTVALDAKACLVRFLDTQVFENVGASSPELPPVGW
jgi:hypothetical protein